MGLATGRKGDEEGSEGLSLESRLCAYMSGGFKASYSGHTASIQRPYVRGLVAETVSARIRRNNTFLPGYPSVRFTHAYSNNNLPSRQHPLPHGPPKSSTRTDTNTPRRALPSPMQLGPRPPPARSVVAKHPVHGRTPPRQKICGAHLAQLRSQI